MTVVLILSVSIILQFTAAFLALRLMRITKHRTAWVLIAVAITLMGVRRSISLYGLIAGGMAHPPNLAAEVVAIATSMLMVLSVAWIAPLFFSIKRSEDKFQKLSDRLEAIMAAVPDIIAQVDSNKVYTWMNHAGLEFFGPDAIGKEVAYYFEGEQRTYDIVQPLFNGKENVFYIESWQRRKDGKKRLLAWWCRVTKDTEGNVTGALSTARDITEQKLAKDKLAHEQHLLTTLMDGSPDHIYFKDRESRFIRTNRSQAMWSGLGDPAEMVGKTDFDFFTKEHARQAHEDEQKIIQTGEPIVNKEEKETWPDGRVTWVSTTKLPLKDADGNIIGTFGISRDTTDQKLAEEALQESQRQLLHAQRMEAIGRLAGGIAHDFRNQLTVVKGYCDLLLPTLTKDDKTRDSIEQIKTAAERAATTTSQLLAFSRKDFLKPEVVNVSLLLHEMQGPLSHIIGEDIRFDIITAEETQNVEVDQTALHQAIMNLVINSRDAMPEGGRLVIETQRVEISTAVAQRHPGATPGTHVLLSVKDTGEGMDTETQNRMFDPFFTTKDVGKGTGLGLSMVYGFVKSGGGHIDVSSKPSEGTTINIYMPWSEKTPEVLAEEGFIPKDILQGSETVLIAEDEQAVRRLIVDVLRERGYTVMETGNAQEALPLGEHYKEKIDLLITDVIMPGMPGPQLAKKLQAIRPEMKTLFISGYSEEAIANQDMIDPARNLLTKPFGPEELAVAVRQFLDKDNIT